MLASLLQAALNHLDTVEVLDEATFQLDGCLTEYVHCSNGSVKHLSTLCKLGVRELSEIDSRHSQLSSTSTE